MRFGTIVTIRRGGHPASMGERGAYRNVQIKYLGAKGSHIYGELLRDDPWSVPPMKSGERMWWGRDVIVKEES